MEKWNFDFKKVEKEESQTPDKNTWWNAFWF
jgi:hypothetical protein